jgi:hypothetical protein
MFVLIGGEPLTAGVEDWLRCDAAGYLMTGPDLYAEADCSWWPLARDPLFLESSQPGLFVAGDIRHGSIKRVASAVGEGAMSIALVDSYLARRSRPSARNRWRRSRLSSARRDGRSLYAGPGCPIGAGARSPDWLRT